MSRMREMRETRRTQQFAKFRNIQLNLIPLVDTFVSIVFFALTTSTVGELAPLISGVTLPDSRVGGVAHQQLTLGIGGQVTLGERAIMSTIDAARARSNDPNEPLKIPRLYTALRQTADSIRKEKKLSQNQSVDIPLAVQADKSMRYDLLARMMQTARLAGFRNLSLQVNRTESQATSQAAN